jgi:hypothetical protein
LFIVIFEIVRVKLERASPARALVYVVLARILQPSPHVYFFFFACSKM